MSYLQISTLVPMNFVDRDRSLPPNFHFRHFDGWKASEQRLHFEQGIHVFQKWQKSDIIFLQVEADYDPIFVKVFKSNGEEIGGLQQQMDLVATVAGRSFFESQLALDDLDEGYYQIEIHAGDPVQVVLESEIIHVLESHPGTLLLKYWNSFNNNILWQTGIYFNFRVEGILHEFTPGSSRTTYIDQPNNAQTVKGTAYRSFKLFAGNENGIPNWMADKLEEIFIQNNVEIDGKGFAPAPGAKLTPARIENYAWSRWDLELRETVNRRAKRFDSEGILDQKVAIGYTVEGSLFSAEGSTNNNTYEINKLG
jgi:hypothetical protein